MGEIIIKRPTSYHGKALKLGDRIDVPIKVEERWVRIGIAQYISSPKNQLIKNFEKSSLKVKSLKKNKPTSIIIPVCDCLDYLKKCLDSIIKYTNKFELIIIDNGSNKKTKSYLSSLKQFDLKVITNKKNKGFGYACNQGIKVAKYGYICFLNSDTIITPNWLYKLQKCFEAKNDCGFASPTTCFSNGMQCDWDLAKNRFSMSEIDILQYSGKLKEEYIQTGICGFCMLTKKKILDKVGVFDWKRYGIGNTEEVDLQWRAEKSGYKGYWVKGAYVHHFGHQTFEEAGISANELVKKNRKLFEERKKDKNLFIENDTKIDKMFKYNIKRNKKTCVVIPVLERKEETIKTLKSLFENNSNINVIIIDNGSKDIDYLKDFKVKIIKNKHNLGTVKAVNQGLSFCQSKYVVVMHNDIVVSIKDWIKKSVKFMEDNFDIGMVGIAGWKKMGKIGHPDWSTVVTGIARYRKNPKGFGEVSVLDGSCNVIRNLDMRLDEIYGYMHLYDIDLSMQYKQRGYKLFVIGGSVEHFAEIPGKSTRVNVDYLRNIGMTDDQYYQKHRKAFLNKWKEYLPIEV